MATCDVAIIGAGPYGLSAAAHLRSVRGLETHVFGEAMSFWERHMPAGMLLRSPWAASHISDPRCALTLDAYQAANGNHVSVPVPLDRFIDYGHWFQRQAVPDVDERRVTRIDSDLADFRLTLEDGEVLKSHHVVVAAGIAPFAWCPPQFEGLSPWLASHSCEHRNLANFVGKQVIVIGGGQSALESAALLHEVGAEVEVVVRKPVVRWLDRSARLRRLGPISRLLYAPADVGPAGVSHIVAVPNLLRRLPRKLQDRVRTRSTLPAGASWLRSRMGGVRITTGRAVVRALPAGDRLHLRLDDGSERHVDRVLLATGYRVNVSRYPFLAPKLVHSLRHVNGYPQLTVGFEASVPGLHFLGAPAAWSFGPLMYFVAGTEYTSCALTRYIAGKAADRVSRVRLW